MAQTGPYRHFHHDSRSYTPIAYAYLDDGWRIALLAIPWTLVLLGVFYKVFWLHAPRVLSPILYLGMGWMSLMPLRELFRAMPLHNFVLLAAGGVAYSIGAIIYAIKKPNPRPGVFGFHEIFHIWILAGGLLHYVLVALTVKRGVITVESAGGRFWIRTRDPSLIRTVL